MPIRMRSNSSRRDFLRTAAVASGGMWTGPGVGSLVAEESDPRVAQILAKAIGIDMHNHVYPAGTEPHPQRVPQNAGAQGGPPARPQGQPVEVELLVGDELQS